MTKYTKQAIVDYVIALVIIISTSMSISLSATLFGIDKVLVVLGIAVFVFCSYKYIKIQSEINERIDQLRSK